MTGMYMATKEMEMKGSQDFYSWRLAGMERREEVHSASKAYGMGESGSGRSFAICEHA